MKLKQPAPPPPHIRLKPFIDKAFKSLFLIKIINFDYIKNHDFNLAVNFLKCQKGTSFVELLVAVVLFAFVAIGSAYWMAQSKVTMKSSAQNKSCPLLARQILEQFITSGTRLYGYSYDAGLSHLDSHPKYRPLLLQYDTSQTNNYKDVKNGSFLKFPGIIKNSILDQIKVQISNSTNAGDWANTGVDLIRFDTATNKIHLGSSVFLINQVNVLQYLYNSDATLFNGNSGKGKKFNMASHSKLKDYASKYDLKDLSLYVAVRPVDLKNNKVITSYSGVKCGRQEGNSYTNYTCPIDGSHRLVLTRPRLSANIQPASNVVLYGNPYLGFEIKVTIEYQRLNSKGNTQDLSCDAMQTFTHQMDTFKRKTAPPSGIQMASSSGYNNLRTSQNNRQTDGDGDHDVFTSCGPSSGPGSHGPDYNDISVEIDFNVDTKEVGTLLVCQGRTGCVSGDSNASYSGNGISCTPETGKWSRCHQVKFPGQTGSTEATMIGNNKLKLKFNDLPDDRRFDLFLAELSTAGTLSQNRRVSRFYIDATRPIIQNRKIPDDDVGKPDDGGTGGRDYTAHSSVSWSKPSGIVSNDKWLQCNTNDVDVEADQEDQFTHNFKECAIEAEKRDGNGTTSYPSSDITIQDTSSTKYKKCKGSLSPDHGRQTVTLTPKDSCGSGSNTSSASKIVWDTDLSFQSQDFNFSSSYFGSDVQALYSSSSPYYSIRTKVPGAGAYSFPKHYTVDCDERWWPQTSYTRDDGNGGNLSCKLLTDRSATNDGCNPNGVGADYWHVCGGSKQTEKAKWAVFAPVSESCKNVHCEPSLICCDGYNNECGSGGSKDKCASHSCPNCTNPNVGGNSDQDSSSGCPPLGLCSCGTYSAPCNGTSPYTKTKAGGCPAGKRSGGSCSFTETGTCTPNAGAGDYENAPSTAGTCSLPNGASCTASLTSYCDQACTHDYSCCTKWNSSRTKCLKTGICYSHSCDDTDYTLSASTCSETVTGTCGTVSGGSCSKKTNRSSGSSSSELCPVRNPGDNSSSGGGGTNPPLGGGGGNPPGGGGSNCSGSGKYSSQSACKSGLPSNKECVQSGGCWVRNTKGSTINGECGSWNGASDASCKKGKFHNHPPDTLTEYKWTCRNIPHNGEVSCSDTIITTPTCTGSGEYPTENNCNQGRPSDKECYQDGSCWKRRDKPPTGVDGQCNRQGKCGLCENNTGSFKSPACSNPNASLCWGTDGQIWNTYYWVCPGLNGGKEKDCQGYYSQKDCT